MKELEGRSKSIFIVTTIFLGISFICVCLRCFVRIKLVKAFGWDDALMVFAMVIERLFSRKPVPDLSELLTIKSTVSEHSFCPVRDHWRVVWNGSEVNGPFVEGNHGDCHVCKSMLCYHAIHEGRNKTSTNQYKVVVARSN